MQIPRFFLMPEDVRLLPDAKAPQPAATDALDLQAGAEIEITNHGIVNQVRNVLRLKAGDRVQLLNGTGLLFECEFSSTAGKSLQCKVTGRQKLPPETVRVTIALAVLKGERFDWALQKLTELGVSTIVPLLTARTVVKIDPGDAKGTAGKLTRWQAIVREAAEQSERGTIPHIVPPKKFTEWLARLNGSATGDTAFICAERIPAEPLRDILLEQVCGEKTFEGTADKTIILVVGPEGGLTSDEIELAQKQGLKPVSLGHRILRSETAAIYALAQVIWCLEK